MKIKDMSLGNKIALPMMLLLLCAFLVIIISKSIMLKQQMITQIDTKAKSFALFIANSSISYVENYDVTTLETLAYQVQEDVDFVSGQFLDHEKQAMTELIKNSSDQNLQVLTVPINGTDGLIGYFQIRYVYSSLDKLFAESMLITLLILLTSFIVLMVALYATLKRQTDKLTNFSDFINEANKSNRISSNELGKTAHNLSHAVSQQAAAVQESAATLNEIREKVHQSVSFVTTATEKAELSQTISNNGKSVVADMKLSMEEIKLAIENVLNENHANNARVAQTHEIIDQIASKASVIDDIVFQTKVLSFNASVEAARAGSHGRGFSVVAEEVGQLARLSGLASSEISALLARSRDDVQNIIQQSEENFGAIVRNTDKTVIKGLEVANQCEEILTEVVNHTSSVNTTLGEILKSSRDQADGVENIASAMNDIDKTTIHNSDMAQQVALCSKDLDKQAVELNNRIQKLNKILKGKYLSKDNKPQEDQNQHSKVISLKPNPRPHHKKNLDKAS